MATPRLPRIVLTYKNRSGDVFECNNLREAYDYASNKVSYGPVSRIEILMPEGSIRAIWDDTWSPQSQASGLSFPT